MPWMLRNAAISLPQGAHGGNVCFPHGLWVRQDMRFFQFRIDPSFSSAWLIQVRIKRLMASFAGLALHPPPAADLTLHAFPEADAPIGVFPQRRDGGEVAGISAPTEAISVRLFRYPKVE